MCGPLCRGISGTLCADSPDRKFFQNVEKNDKIIFFDITVKTLYFKEPTKIKPTEFIIE
jgi:hypothetical protein